MMLKFNNLKKKSKNLINLNLYETNIDIGTSLLSY